MVVQCYRVFCVLFPTFLLLSSRIARQLDRIFTLVSLDNGAKMSPKRRTLLSLVFACIYYKFESASALVDCYETTSPGSLEQHAPIKERVVTIRPAAPWYNDQIRKEHEHLANTFDEFFQNKVQSLRETMLEVADSPQVSTSGCHSPAELLEFSPTNITELSSLLRSTARKSRILDPVPGTLLKDCYDVLLPVIMRIVNLSLDNATVPMKLKEAALTPITKKESLDHELYPSYRPIYNILFVS